MHNESGTDSALAHVLFMPSGRRGRFEPGTPLLQAARSLGVDIDSVCGGRGLCGRCAVQVAEGSYARHQIESGAKHASTLSEAEQIMCAKGKLPDGQRLACSTRVQGDLLIDVPAASQVHRQVIRKDAEALELTLEPLLHLYYVELPTAQMQQPDGDLQRLYDALSREWGLHNLACDLHVLQALQGLLHQGKQKLTLAVHATSSDNPTIVAIWPGLRQRLWGIACDIGSTTLAVHLCELDSGQVLASAGAMNPQIRFGEDLMSRISYLMLQPQSLPEICSVVQQAMGQLASEAAQTAGGETNDILLATFVGNPVMQHLFMGIDPSGLGSAPFTLASNAAHHLRASELGLVLHPGARSWMLPCIAGHVGSDAAGMLLAERPDLNEEVCLLVDIGTNAEIILGNNKRLLACSSPTGPAFEGAQIECGQRAAPGAIERIRIDRQTLVARFKIIGCECWSDEADFADRLDEAKLTVSGICGSGIIEAVGEMFLAGIIDADGKISGQLATQTERIQPNGRTFSYSLHRLANGSDIRITQNDIRAIQLAKAALYAGAKLLMLHMGTERVERIRLAGAFGSHIDPQYAMLLGLIPDCDLKAVRAVGNAASVGARIALLNKSARAEIEALSRRIEKIETAIAPQFQELFVSAMSIPHRSDPYTNLRTVIPLPKRKAASNSMPGKSARRNKRQLGPK